MSQADRAAVNGTLPARAGVARNSGWNLVGFAATLALQFLTVPFVVRWIGLAAFGEAGLVLAVCAPLTLVGTVLGQALTREAANAGHDAHRQRAAFGAAARLCLLASGAGLLLLGVLGPVVTRLFGAAVPAQVQLAFVLAAAGWAFQQVSLLLQGLFAARQDFRTIARVTIASASLGATCVLACTWLQPDAAGYLAGQSLAFMAAACCWLWAARADLHALTQPAQADVRRSLLQFGGWQSVSQVAGALANQADRYALGSFTSATAVGQFTAANRLQEAAYIGIVKASEVLFPRFGSMSDQSPARRARVFQLASWILGVFSAAMLGPMVVLADDLLVLWIGPQAASGAGTMLRTLVLGGMLGAVSNVFSYYAMGLGHTRLLAGMSVIYSVLTITGTVALIAWVGAVAAGAGLLLATLVRIAIALALTRNRLLPHLSWQELAASTLMAPLAGTAVALGLAWLAAIRVDGWWMMALAYLLVGLVIAAAALAATVCLPGGRLLLADTLTIVRGFRPVRNKG